MIGTFGSVVFESSTKKVNTIDEFNRTSTADFAEHKTLDGKPRLQFLGEGLDKITFTMRLNIFLGVIPEKQIKILQDIKAAGEAQTLIIGDTPLGNFVVTELNEKWPHIDGKGNLIVAYMDITLKEYVS